MSATPPPPPLDVASAGFFRLECSHAQLFQPEYKRSNRTKGLKILRCFPHCCPEHIDRSYCGASLSVRVELAAPSSDAAAPADPPPSQVVTVFARFEATSDAGTQSDSNLEGQWVAGSLDRPSRLVTTIRAPGTPSDDHKPLVFHLNGKPFSRWYYDWESGANKAQRLMKHVLKAYIVERCAIDQDDNFTAFTSRHARTQLYRVLSVVTSPEFTISDRLEDQLRWEHANESAVSMSKNLALAYSLVRWAPLGVYASCVDEINSLLRALAQAALWFFSKTTQRWVRAFFLQYAESVLDKHSLRACFVLFVKETRNRLDTEVFQNTQLQSLANVAEEVIAAVYSCSFFHARRPQIREILSGQSFAGWNAFVAQMRQTYVNVSTCPRSISRTIAVRDSEPNFNRAHPPQNSIESDWNAEWFLQVDEAVWKPSQQTMKADSKSGSCVLRIRSTEGVASALDCMCLVLDGKERVFSQFPNGLASGIGSGRHGDYIGETRVEKPGRLVVYLQVFTWSTEIHRPSYHVRLRIECWQSKRLCVSGDVLATTAPASFPLEDTSNLGEMPLRMKRAAVANFFEQQLQDYSAGEWATSPSAGPWRELGRFRLSYLKF
ncbi:hypothetical protein PHYSODRAFT_470615 [Phytophthora sojae]|uniref:Uncharacterized protein n=1 Tax=Phytophthora sojae (strain P6497) TaxID=1094619 RepID=G4YJT3_PHYSP|nr:hypothetical protein PHYSODRAFT_470615 [Phytophthora sojae]EGZ26640.1 hypothetical protein PHYSODRAFT_470615 [Phytophthora sojae]|eukprot:XP_009513915.1 hypothetical protein PHYSODRAFT_470615 [Phytophthora sojae]